eukprot:CAMPEP_0114552946 /NCGR_PEP_ID=MMETSP0114-20121206/7392_1 /TAXON_ID=31324 /ORGANISM="Goniomonas sp, Strain m" /LENGTH=306 /DNA_ID=CAMNT_0001737849 /DNA_START=9 /DNA_END=929 /DNA_ORIENTATION=+
MMKNSKGERTMNPTTCATTDGDLVDKEEGMAMIVAGFLQHIASDNNDRLRNGVKDTYLTPFHATNDPNISMLVYVKRLQDFCGASPCAFLNGMIYVDRALVKMPGFLVSSFSVHRLYLTCLLIAAKFLDDDYYSNAHWADVGGISLKELNRLEVDTLFLLNFDLNVTPLEYSQYSAALRSNKASPKAQHAIDFVDQFEAQQDSSNRPSQAPSSSSHRHDSNQDPSHTTADYCNEQNIQSYQQQGNQSYQHQSYQQGNQSYQHQSYQQQGNQSDQQGNQSHHSSSKSRQASQAAAVRQSHQHISAAA